MNGGNFSLTIQRHRPRLTFTRASVFHQLSKQIEGIISLGVTLPKSSLIWAVVVAADREFQRERPVRLSFVAAVERGFSSGFRARLLPIATALDATLHDRDDRSVSRRIAVVAFSVRVLSAFIAYISPGAARPLDGRFRVRRLRRRLGRRGDPRRCRLPRLPDGDRPLRAGIHRARREGASARRAPRQPRQRLRRRNHVRRRRRRSASMPSATISRATT